MLGKRRFLAGPCRWISHRRDLSGFSVFLARFFCARNFNELLFSLQDFVFLKKQDNISQNVFSCRFFEYNRNSGDLSKVFKEKMKSLNNQAIPLYEVGCICKHLSEIEDFIPGKDLVLSKLIQFFSYKAFRDIPFLDRITPSSAVCPEFMRSISCRETFQVR